MHYSEGSDKMLVTAGKCEKNLNTFQINNQFTN